METKPKLYTGNGDGGMTYKGQPKSDAIFDLLGDIDELHSFLGYLGSYNEQYSTEYIQEYLMRLSTSISQNKESEYTEQETLDRLEKEIDEMTQRTPSLRNFILIRGHHDSCFSHICRTVCRRCERKFCTYYSEKATLSKGNAILNRLSTWLFAYARFINHSYGIHDHVFRPKI